MNLNEAVSRLVEAYCDKLYKTVRTQHRAIELIWPQAENCLRHAMYTLGPEQVLNVYFSSEEILVSRNLQTRKRWARTAMRAARQSGDTFHRARIAKTLGHILFLQGQSQLAYRLQRAAYRALRRDHPRDAVRTLADMVMSLFACGRPRLGSRLADRLLKQSDLDDSLRPKLLNTLAIQNIHTGQPKAAAKQLSIAASMLHNEGDSYANTLANLGRVMLMLDDARQCKSCLDEAASVSKQRGSSLQTRCVILGNYIPYYAAVGDYRACQIVGEQALSIANHLNEPKHQIQILTMLSSVLARQGHIDKAIELAEQAQQIAVEMQEPRELADVLGSYASLHQQVGRTDLAIHYERQRRKLLAPLGDSYGRAIAALNLAVRYRRLGQLRLAKGAYTASYNYFKGHNESRSALANRRLKEIDDIAELTHSK